MEETVGITAISINGDGLIKKFYFEVAEEELKKTINDKVVEEIQKATEKSVSKLLDRLIKNELKKGLNGGE
jgi:hypothetical protein